MEVACLGLMVCDVLVRPVDADLFKRDSVRVESIRMSSGGDAFNVAVDLASMGILSGIVGKVGDDGFGRFLLEAAASAGVDASHVVVSDRAGTASCVVLVHSDGERSFAYQGGTNDLLSAEDVDRKVLSEVRILHVGSAFELPALDGTGLASILRKARAHGVTTVLDVTGNPGPSRVPELAALLPHVDFFLPSRGEAEALTGLESPDAITSVFCAMGAGTTVLKDGRNGCHLRSGPISMRIPAFSVNAVDTTGSGDAFVAGFIAGMSRGLELRECARIANATGALCASVIGATGWSRSFEEVVDWMRKQEE